MMSFRFADCPCCGPKGCQALYNPATNDCSWFLQILGNHTPTGQPGRLDFTAGGTPQAGTDYPKGVQPDAATGVLINPEHTGIDLPPMSDSFSLLLPLGFNAADESPCQKSASRSATNNTGWIADPKGSIPPASYTLNWQNVSMANVPMHYDKVQTVSVGSGSAGTGAAYDVQVFSNTAAGLSQGSKFSAAFGWGQFTEWAASNTFSFDGERSDYDGGAGDFSSWATSLTLASIIDPTSVEYDRTLLSNQSASFNNGNVSASYSGSMVAVARGTRRVYSGNNLVVTSAAQGTFTGPSGTTVAKLESYDSTNVRVGFTHDGAEIWLHPLCSALGILLSAPAPGGSAAPIILTFAVRTDVDPAVEGLYTFNNLGGDAVPDGWGGGQYVNQSWNSLLDFVGNADQTWNFWLNQVNELDRSPVFGTAPVDSSNWSGSPANASAWRDRAGFSFDLNSGDTADILTASRNDCPE